MSQQTTELSEVFLQLTRCVADELHQLTQRAVQDGYEAAQRCQYG